MKFNWFFNLIDQIKYYFTSAYFFITPPETNMFWVWLGLFVILFVAVIFVYFYLKVFKGRTEAPYRAFAKKFLWPNLTLVFLGLFNVFSRYESISLFSWRFWGYLILTISITFNVWIFVVKYAQLEDELVKFHDNKRKAKWLKKNK